MRLAAISSCLLALLAAPAHAQLPQTLPANSVVGRLGIGSGPGQAIPFSVLNASIFDTGFCNTVGYLVVRFTGAWTCDNSIPASPKWWGAKLDGVTDDTAAWSAILSSGAKNIAIPAGTMVLSGTCPTISANGTRIVGAGRGATLISSTCSGATLNVASGVSYLEVRDLKMTRTVVASSGQDGIRCNTVCDYALIDNVWIEGHYNGFRLAGASFNKLERSVANNNQNHGILVTNTDGCAGLQWTLLNNLSQQSNGDGLRVEAVSCTATVGEIINQSTFANKGKGARFTGVDASHRLEGVRISGGFFGQDCDDEVYLDTYGVAAFKLVGGTSELAGTGTCGVNLTTAATNVGRGVVVTNTLTAGSVVDWVGIQNSQNGIESSAGRITINDGVWRLNGQAMGVGQQSGIQIDAGVALISGNHSVGNTAFGLRILVDAVLARNNDLCGNTTGSVASIALTASLTGDNLCGNLGIIQSPSATLTLANGLNSNIAMPTGEYSYLQISGPSAAFSVGGITGGADGRVLRLQNKVSQAMTIVNQDASSSAANRITTLTGGNVILPASVSIATFVYDGTAGAWMLTGTEPASLGSLGTTTTVLHGNAAGYPTYSAVSLTADVSGTLPVANGGTGDTGTAWTTYTPTVTCGTGSLTTTTRTGRYKTLGKTVFFEANMVITTNGTCATSLNFALPPGVTAASNSPIVGEDFTAGKTLTAGVNSGATSTVVLLYDGSYPGADGKTLAIGGALEMQ